jgi:hypothetical protein
VIFFSIFQKILLRATPLLLRIRVCLVVCTLSSDKAHTQEAAQAAQLTVTVPFVGEATVNEVAFYDLDQANFRVLMGGDEDNVEELISQQARSSPPAPVAPAPVAAAAQAAKGSREFKNMGVKEMKDALRNRGASEAQLKSCVDKEDLISLFQSTSPPPGSATSGSRGEGAGGNLGA